MHNFDHHAKYLYARILCSYGTKRFMSVLYNLY